MVTGPPSRSMSPRAVRTRAMHWSRRCWAASIKWEVLSARIGCASGRVAGGIVVPVRRRLEFVTVGGGDAGDQVLDAGGEPGVDFGSSRAARDLSGSLEFTGPGEGVDVDRQELRSALEVSAHVAAVRSGLGARAGDVPAAPASGHCVQAAADLLGQPLDTRQVTVSLEADDLALEVEADLVLLLVLTAQSVIGDPGVVLLHPPGGMPEDLANGAAGDTRVRTGEQRCWSVSNARHGHGHQLASTGPGECAARARAAHSPGPVEASS